MCRLWLRPVGLCMGVGVPSTGAIPVRSPHGTTSRRCVPMRGSGEDSVVAGAPQVRLPLCRIVLARLSDGPSEKDAR